MHKTKAMVQFGSMPSSLEFFFLQFQWLPNRLTLLLCHCDNKSDSWLSCRTLHGRVFIKQAPWKWATLKRSCAESFVFSFIFWQDGWGVRLELDVKFLDLEQIIIVYEMLCWGYTMNLTMTSGTKTQQGIKRTAKIYLHIPSTSMTLWQKK